MLRSFLMLIALLSAFAIAGVALAIDPAPVADALVAADPAHAEDGHEKVGAIPNPKQGLYTAITALIVFIIVLAVFSAKVWPPISKALAEREAKIRNSIEEAEMAQQQARQALEQYERNLASARAEAQKMLDDAKTQQQVIAAELKSKADAELASMRDKAKRDIDASKAAAIAEIHSHATSLATAMAGKILKREINAGDQQRLIQESLQELQTAGRA